jgi:hypothetical protein
VGLPLHLCQVLEQEFVAVHGPLQREPGWSLEEAHFTDGSAAFAQHLAADAENPLSAWLRDRLAGGGADRVAGLNALLHGGALYTPASRASGSPTSCGARSARPSRATTS